jgi:hypothetical protein
MGLGFFLLIQYVPPNRLVCFKDCIIKKKKNIKVECFEKKRECVHFLFNLFVYMFFGILFIYNKIFGIY